MLDRDGSLRQCCERVLAEHPDATFEELEAQCFPGRDGEFGLVALSPRHLEAVATRTCQVLIEGEYDGVLEPDRHYIPLRRDFSNLDAVLETMRRDDERERIVETAYREIVASGAWSYPRFVERLEETTLGGPPRGAAPRSGARRGRLGSPDGGRGVGCGGAASRAGIAGRQVPAPVSTRVCMFLAHPLRHDTRVEKEAAALADAGYEVRIVATAFPGLPAREERSGFTVVRVDDDPLPGSHRPPACSGTAAAAARRARS